MGPGAQTGLIGELIIPTPVGTFAQGRRRTPGPNNFRKAKPGTPQKNG